MDFLSTCLRRRHFVGSSKDVTTHLTTLSDAFCAAYAENDVVGLQLCIDFLKVLDLKATVMTSSAAASKEKLMSVIKQLFCIADFSGGDLIR